MNKIIPLVIYILFLILFMVFSYTFVDPGLIYLKNLLTNFTLLYREETTILYVFCVSVFFGFYVLFLWLLKKKVLHNKDIIRLIMITTAILFFTYPAMLSFDIFNYIATAKVLFHYHENPYIIMPVAFAGDPLLLFTHAANKVALYGFFWIFLSGIPFLLGFGYFLLTLFLFKLLIFFFYFATIFVIWKITKNVLSIALFALNPLVVIETLISSHNDIVMVFFMLFAWYLLKEKKIIYAGIFLLMSVFIKYATVFLLPVFIFVLWKTVKKKNIQWDKIFFTNAIILFIVMLSLGPVREEIYPWYAIWFFSFVCLIPRYKMLFFMSMSILFGLLLRYIPFMLLGTYAEPTPVIKILVTFVPPFIALSYFSIRRFLYGKEIY